MKVATSILFLFLIFEITSVKAQKAIVTADRMNVLYIGIENPVTVMADGVKCSQLLLEIDSNIAIIQKQSNLEVCKFIINPRRVGKATLKIYRKVGKNKISLIDEVDFRVRHLPEAVASIGGKLKGGYIAKGTLKAQMGIIANYENFDFDAKIKVLSYSLYHCKDGTINIIHNLGPLFSQEIYNAIENTKPGEILAFDDIIASYPNGNLRRLNPISFTIDGYLFRGCDSGKFTIPFIPSIYQFDSKESQNGYNRITLNCTCDCIDEAIGNYDADKQKTGWWVYNKIYRNAVKLARKEYYNGDTTIQLFFDDGHLTKERSFIGKKLNGNYSESYKNGMLKIQGKYDLDTIGCDTVWIVDIETSEEKETLLFRIDEVKVGVWQYFSLEGKLYRRETYENGKVIRTEEF
jgi:hypothetical protein